MKPKKYKASETENAQVCEPEALYGVPEIRLDPAIRYSYADYLTWTDHRRRELFDGFARLMAGVGYLHNAATVKITSFFYQFVQSRKGKCVVFHAPFDVRLPKNRETSDDKIYTVVQPDVCVVCDPSKIDERGIIGAPDLVVEVQSPSTARLDFSKKFDLYEEVGVKEYWIVYPGEGLTVFLLQKNGKYDNGTNYDAIFMPGKKVPVQTLKGLEIDLQELFDKK